MLLTSGIISTVLGFVSGTVGHWFKAKEERDKREHDMKMMEMNMQRDRLNSELAIAEINANLEVQKVITEGTLLTTEAEGWNEAIAEITKNKLPVSTLNHLLNGNWFKQFFGIQLAYLLGITDVIRGLIRPVLTISSFVVVTYVAYILLSSWDDIIEVNRVSLLYLVIDAVIYLLTASVQFWFMDRAGARDFRSKHAQPA